MGGLVSFASPCVLPLIPVYLAVVTTVLRALGAPLGVAVASASFATDLLDKAIACALVSVVLRSLPGTLAARFPALAR